MRTKRGFSAFLALVFCLLIFSPLSGMEFTKKQMKVLRCVGKIENFLPAGRRIYGSGTLIKNDYVFSCFHLIRHGVGHLIIRFEGDDGQVIVRNLDVISTSPDNDLALYKIDRPMPKGWGHMKIAKKLTAGDELMYAGFNASGLARLRFDIAEHYPLYGTMLHPIYFGDSGGGVFKANGRLIGLIHILIIDTRFGYATNSYIGYAVSLEKVRTFLKERKVIR